MKLELIQRTELRQTQTHSLEHDLLLEPPEKEAVLAAEKLWNSKRKYSFSIDLNKLNQILSSGVPMHKRKELPGGIEDINFNMEYVSISPEEMALLDEDERYGFFIGDYVFVSSDFPREYMPFVLINFATKKCMRHDARIVEFLRSHGIEPYIGKHWTANLVDMKAAAHTFGDDSEEFQAFMKWRQEIERSDFFENEMMAEFLSRIKKYEHFKQTTHPAKRGKWANRSWKFATMASSKQLQGQGFERHHRDFGANKCDMIYLNVIQKPKFNANEMVRFLRHLQANAKKCTIKSRERWVISTEDSDMAQMAGLLSESGVGKDLALMSPGKNPGEYVLASRWQATIDPLVDRIVYFTGKLLEIKSDGPDLIGFFRTARVLLLSEISDGELQIDLGDKEMSATEKIQAKIDSLYDKYDEIYELLEKYELAVKNLQERSDEAKKTAITFVQVDEKKIQLESAAREIFLEIQRLEDLKEAAGEIDEISQRMGALLDELPTKS